MRIYYDENGKEIDFLSVRNEEIKDKLQPILDEFLEEKSNMLTMKKPVKLGYQFTKQLYMVFASYPKMPVEDFISIDYDTLNDYWLKYLELTAFYNRYFEIVDNKQTFMAFCGINSRQYNDLENHNDEDIKNLMLMINGSFVGLGFVASESGNAGRLTKLRLEAKNVGHSVISEKEDKLLNVEEVLSPDDLKRKMLIALGKNEEIKKLK